MKPIRVLIVEDSGVVRELLQHIIENDPRLTVAAAVASAEEALRILDRVRPDIISLDIRLPGIDGFEATRRIMSRRPTPIVVVSASVEAEDLNITMEALQAGALTVLEKPVGTTRSDYAVIAERLCTQLVIMSEVKVVGQRGYRAVSELRASKPMVTPPSRHRGSFSMLGIVASTGGPNAVAAILNGLGRDFPLPILLVQHISGSFLEGLVSWLNRVGPLPVEIIGMHHHPLPGRVYMAPPHRQLQLRAGGLWTGGDPLSPLESASGSGTVLFQSMASVLGPKAIGVLLTGMGADGAEGLLEIHQAGGYTIAEDESTTVVYGMPAAAVALNAVSESLPLPAISPRIHQLLAESAASTDISKNTGSSAND